MLHFLHKYSPLQSARGRITLTCLISLALPLIVAIGFYTGFIHELLVTKVGDELLSGIVHKNVVMDDKLNSIQLDANKLSLDESLYEIFAKEPMGLSDTEFFRTDREVSQALMRAYSNQSEVYASYLVTNDFLFGRMQVFHTLDILKKSLLYQNAVASSGEGIWISTFAYSKMFQSANAYSTSLNYSPFFAFVKKVRFISQNQTGTTPSEDQLPILILYFQSGFFDKIFFADEGFNTDVWVFNNKELVYTNTAATDSEFDLNEIQRMDAQNGSFASANGEKLLAYTRSKETGWITVASKSITDMMQETYNMTELMLFSILITGILVSAIVFFLVKRILHPLNDVAEAIKQSGEGHFKIFLPPTSTEELTTVVQAYNHMNVKIDTLIEDIYRAKLSETKAKLFSMHLQMEPHFLYNTLNAINWLAVDNDQTEISEMLGLLANMLRYTLSQEQELVDFKDDIKWIEAYTRILRLRFGDHIIFDFSRINKELFQTKVPLLLLQPFIENSVVHGINGYIKEGRISISGKIVGGTRVFMVRDNGKGMTEEELLLLWEKNPQHLGIRNVDLRIKMIYGEEWGVQIVSDSKGTKVEIKMPL